jgi:hypothetical protein
MPVKGIDEDIEWVQANFLNFYEMWLYIAHDAVKRGIPHHRLNMPRIVYDLASMKSEETPEEYLRAVVIECQAYLLGICSTATEYPTPDDYPIVRALQEEPD